MKTHPLFLILLSLATSCKYLDSKVEPKPERLRIELGGAHYNHPILNPQSARPSVWFSCVADTCSVQVGNEEPIFISIVPDSIRYLKERVESLLPIPETYLVKNVYDAGFLTIIRDKKIKSDTIHISDYQRMNIPIVYHEASDSVSTAALDISRMVERIVRFALYKGLSPGRIVYATSMKEALETPLLVEKLTLRNLRKSQLDNRIVELEHLKILDISGSLVKSLPNEICELTDLIELTANASQLERLPDCIGDLKHLRILNVGYTPLDSLPLSVGNLTSLWSLNLSDTKLKAIPDTLSSLVNLTFFSAANNNLSEFPNAVLGMKSVGNLWLHGNAFQEVPKALASLNEMHHLLIDASEIPNIYDVMERRPNVRIIDENRR